MISEKCTGYDFRKLLKAYEILYRLKLEEVTIDRTRPDVYIMDLENISCIFIQKEVNLILRSVEFKLRTGFPVYFVLSLENRYFGCIEIKSLSEIIYVLDCMKKIWTSLRS